MDYNAAIESILEEYLITWKLFIQLFKVGCKIVCTVWGLLFKYIYAVKTYGKDSHQNVTLFLDGKITELSALLDFPITKQPGTHSIFETDQGGMARNKTF